MTINQEEETEYRKIEKQYRKHHVVVSDKKKPLEAPEPSYDLVLDFQSEKNTEKNKQNIRKVDITSIMDHDHINEYCKKYIQHNVSKDQLVQKYLFHMNHNEQKSKMQVEQETQNEKDMIEGLIEWIKSWEVYGLKSHDGFYYIMNPFSTTEKCHWVKQCVLEYAQPPNITNHFMKYGIIKDIFKKGTIEDATGLDKKLLKKMSWCTLGYQYDWTNRKYHADRKVDFPSDIGSLMGLIACATGNIPYEPEAAIINYYSQNQTMGGHLDNAEYAMDKPIISTSFGNNAVFLLGGETKDIEPTPIMIHSGDIMIMGGRARNCFHGIARIINNSVPKELLEHPDISENKALKDYMLDRRININTRQVFPKEGSK